MSRWFLARSAGSVAGLVLAVACSGQDSGPTYHPSGKRASTTPDGGAGGTGVSARGDAIAAVGTGEGSGSIGTEGAVDGGADGATTVPWRGPLPPQNGAAFPFPQNRESAPCIYPTDYSNEDVLAAYETWKADVVTAEGAGGYLRAQRLADDPVLELNSTVSEGIAYGLMIAVYMNDQPLFDGLWKYEQLWTDPATGLMHWYINAEGTDLGENGVGAATDADEDMAWALVMADRQWGGQGTLDRTYVDYAKGLIAAIWAFEIYDFKLPRNGSQWGDWLNLNISYFAPAYYRVFAEVSSNSAWVNSVVKTVYDTIDNNLDAEKGNLDNGLVPAWSTSEGGSVPGQPFHYQYDSCRTPFRVGLDACFNGEPRALAYVGKTSSFFSAVGASGIEDGYELDGTPRPEHPGEQSAAFVGPAGVGAMAGAEYQDFLDDTYRLLVSGNLLCGGQYYDESWTVLSLLMMTGNFLDYTKY